MPDLSPNPTFGFVAPNALQNAPPAFAPAPTLSPDIAMTPEQNLATPFFDQPTFMELNDPFGKQTVDPPTLNPPHALQVESMPEVTVPSVVQQAVQQNEQNVGLHGPTVASALHGALLGQIANQTAVQEAMQNLALAPPVGYMEAFNAPMSMAEALNATVAAMNPSMSAPSSDDGDTGDAGDAGDAGDSGGIGSEGGGGGAAGQGGGPGGSPGSGGVSSPGMGGIGSEGGGGGVAGAAAAEGGGGSPSGQGGIGSEGGGGGPSGGAAAGEGGEGGEGGE